jgi:hypothetical protein
MGRRILVWSVATALVLVPVASLVRIRSFDCLEDLDGLAYLVGPILFAVLAYILFVVAGPRIASVENKSSTRWPFS